MIIAPTRGSNTMTDAAMYFDARGDHRPYEGQQRAAQPRVGGEDPAVIIAPTRGSNIFEYGAQQAAGGVIIAPTRGSNAAMLVLVHDVLAVIIAPTRGSNFKGRQSFGIDVR